MLTKPFLLFRLRAPDIFSFKRRILFSSAFWLACNWSVVIIANRSVILRRQDLLHSLVTGKEWNGNLKKHLVDINKFWFRLQVLMYRESIERDGMQLFMFRNLHRIIQGGKELWDHQAWPLPQQCHLHYFTSFSLFSWNSSHLPQCNRNLRQNFFISN